MNNDLISREALKKDIQTEWLTAETKQTFYKIIDNAPTVEPAKVVVANFTFDKDELDQIVRERVIEPIKNGELVIKDKRPHGKWLYPYEINIACECSNCHLQTPITDYFNFCPNCGAQMIGGEAE